MFANNNNNDSAYQHVRPILYYDDINPHSRAILMLLNMLDVDVELRAVEMIKGEHLKADYIKINPARTVPSLVHKDLVITGNAIFTYVCENNESEKAKQLLALKCYKRYCRVISRLFYESQVLHRIHGQLMTDLVRKTMQGTDIEYHRKQVEHAYDVMEIYLKDSPFIAGSVLTAADISFIACLGALDMMFPIADDPRRWEKLIDWFRRMRSLTIQKINTNGIEKQRRIVEYFAKFSFKSNIKRFTMSVRDSQIPRMSMSHRRCTIAIQTDEDLDQSVRHEERPKIATRALEDVEEDKIEEILDSKELEGALALSDLRNVATERVQTVFAETQDASEEKSQDVLRDSGNAAAETIENIIEQIEVAHEESAHLVQRSLRDDEIEIIESLPLDASATSVSNKAPDYPAPPTEEEINELINGKDGFLNSTHNETTQAADEIVSNGAERSAGGAQKERPPIPPKRIRKVAKLLEATTESQSNSFSRLNGGVVPVVAPQRLTGKKGPNSNGPPQLSTVVNKSQTKAPKVEEPETTKESTTIEEKSVPTEKSIIPSNVPLNCPQTALQYCRGVNAPTAPLAAPPPTPEPSSQDDCNDEEFPPPPPPEVLLQSTCSRGKTARAMKTAKLTLKETVARGVVKKLSGLKSNSNDSKVASNSTFQKTALQKHTADAKQPGRRAAASEPKTVKKSSSRLVASGTKSPSSNVSQASLLMATAKARRVQRTASGSTTTTKTAAAAKSQDKTQDKTQAESEPVSKVALPKSSKRSLTSNSATDSSFMAKKRRAEGGGQGKSKEILPPALNSEMAVLRAALNDKLGVRNSNKIKWEKLPSTTPPEASSSPKLSSKPPNEDTELPTSMTVVLSKPSEVVVKTAKVVFDSNAEANEAKAETLEPALPQSSKQTANANTIIAAKVAEVQTKTAAVVVENANAKVKASFKGTSPHTATTSSIALKQQTPASLVKSTAQNLPVKIKSKMYPSRQQTSRSQTTAKVFDTSPYRPDARATKVQSPTKQFDTSPYRPNQRSFRNPTKVVPTKRILIKNKKKKGAKVASEEMLNKSQSALAKSTAFSAPAVEGATAQSSAPEVANADVEEPTATTASQQKVADEVQITQQMTVNVGVAGNGPKTSQTTLIVQPTNNSEKVNAPIAAAAPMTVGLVAKTLQALNEATARGAVVKNVPPKPPPLPPPPVAFSPTPTLKAHTPRERTPAPRPPIPPPPPPPPPLRRPSVVAATIQDALPKAGTVAKALKSLSAVTSEAQPLSGTTKPFTKSMFKFKNTEESAISTQPSLTSAPLGGPTKPFTKSMFKFQNSIEEEQSSPTSPQPSVTSALERVIKNEKLTLTAEQRNAIRPLAELLTASVRHTANRRNNKLDETQRESEIVHETQQSLVKSKKLSDKIVMSENPVQAAVEQKTMAANVKEGLDAVVMNTPTEAAEPPNELTLKTNENALDTKAKQELNIKTESVCTISGRSYTIQTDAMSEFNEEPALPSSPASPSTSPPTSSIATPPLELVVESPGSSATVTSAHPPAALVLNDKRSATSISEFHESLTEPQTPSAACTENSNLSNLSENETAAPPPAPPTIEMQTLAETPTPTPPQSISYRQFLDMAMINRGMEIIESTPLPTAQPNIIITGFTHSEPKTQQQPHIFAGTGCALGNNMQPPQHLRGVLTKAKAPCTHGPSASVVISTFGYSPMSDTDKAQEQLLPIKSKYTNVTTQEASSMPPLMLNSTTTPTTAATTTTQLNVSQQQQQLPMVGVVQPVRSLSPRHRPYPTAHRSRSQRG